MLRRLSVFLLLAGITACGGSNNSGSTTPGEGSRRSRVLRADVTAPAVPAQETYLADGSLLVVRGGRRLLLGENSITAASLDFASPIVGLAEQESGFLFLTADGILHRTADGTVLGRPERAGSTSLERMSPLGASRGRLVVLAGDLVGDLYSSDGGEFVKAALPARSVLAGTFTDESHGCALLFDGTGRYTSDGGRSYSPVPGLGRAFALDLHHGSCRFHVGSEAEPAFQTVDGRGHAIAYEHEEDAPRDGVYPYRPAELYIARGSMARLGRSRAIAIGPEPTTVQVFSLDDGRLLATREGALPESCTLLDVGDKAAAICSPEEGEPSAFITSDGETFSPLLGLERALSITGAQVYGSDDGQIAWTGPCNDDPAIASEDDTICVLRNTADGTHVSVMISEHGASSIRGLAGDYMLLGLGAADRYWVAKLGTDESFDVRIPSSARILDVKLASDATLIVLAEEEGRVRSVYIGAAGSELERRSLPEGAVDVAFQTAETGVAAGRSMRQVFRTRDGGRSWGPMRVSIEGDPSTTPLLDPERYLECHRNYCLGFSWRGGRGRTVVIRPMDEAETPTTLSAAGPDRLGDEPRSGLVLPTALRCELVDGTTEIARPAPAAARTSATRTYGDGRYFAWVDESVRGRRATNQIHWRGTDDVGEYSAASRIAESNAARGTSVRMDVITAGRGGALLNVCTQTGDRRECRFAMVEPGGVPQILMGEDPHTITHGMVVAAYTMRELFFVVAPAQNGPKVFLFDPSSGGSSALALGDHMQGAFAGIAQSALGPYFVITDPTARLWQAIVEQDRGVAFPPFAALTDLRIDACKEQQLSASVRWPGRIRLRVAEQTIESNGFAEIGLSDGPACIMGYGLSSDPTLARLRSTPAGSFEGFVDRGAEGLRNIRCTLP